MSKQLCDDRRSQKGSWELHFWSWKLRILPTAQGSFPCLHMGICSWSCSHSSLWLWTKHDLCLLTGVDRLIHYNGRIFYERNGYEGSKKNDHCWTITWHLEGMLFNCGLSSVICTWAEHLSVQVMPRGTQMNNQQKSHYYH